MKLPHRLAAVAEFIPQGKVVADIGSDHGYLPVYLAKKGISPLTIATEVSYASLQKVRSLSEKHEVENLVLLRQGDGLFALEKGDAPEVLVVAGMGGHSIVQILQQNQQNCPGADRMVLQPMRDDQFLRYWLLDHGFCITGEKLSYEKGRFYIVMSLSPGVQLFADPIAMEVGPLLLERGDPLLPAYLRHKINYYKMIMDKLSNKVGEKSKEQFSVLKDKVDRLEEVLSVVDQGKKGGGTDRTVSSSLSGRGRRSSRFAGWL